MNRVPLIDKVDLKLYDLIYQQAIKINLGPIMNFHVKEPKSNDRDTVVFAHLYSVADCKKLQTTMNNVFFFGKFIIVSLQPKVIDEMTDNEKARKECMSVSQDNITASEVVLKNVPLVLSKRELELGNEEEVLESLRREIKDVNDKLDTIERRQFRLFQFLRD